MSGPPSFTRVAPGDARLVETSGLLDGDWYSATYADVVGDAAALSSFCEADWRRGFQPNPYFDPRWYAATYADEIPSGEHPLLHYIRSGERADAWPSPHFDTEWYRDVHAIGADASPLAHYLYNCKAGSVSPLPVFDAAAYAAEHQDWHLTAYDPYWHSRQQRVDTPDPPPFSASPWGKILATLGCDPEDPAVPEIVSGDALKEALRPLIPLIPFDAAWYTETYPDIAAALACRQIESAHGHFIDFGFFEGRSPGAPDA